MSRETDLDRTRQYYELLYLTPEEILKHIVEHGPQFTEQEYTNLLALSYRSKRGLPEAVLDETLRKLSDILVKYDTFV
ncbi:hypothetical protein LSH36_2505g00001 [Paralvinella palmiformis]|uniref:Exocyst complex component Sec8 n=1 Tax=Paralvinella palmiformis TaxID=53620 RepID=A0AAD9IQK2_9ANNE|nr:hypothetical protein LSH36_2505g00001 [Paralvinella palmiformis]